MREPTPHGQLPQHLVSWLRGVCSVDVRAVALFRLCLGVVVCIDVLRRADTLDFYTDMGNPIQVPGDTQHRCVFHQIWFFKGTREVQALLLGMTFLCSASLAAGLWTPVASFLTWAGVTAIHGRNECINDSSDKMLRNVLFWAMMLPLGCVGSVDSLRARPSQPLASVVYPRLRHASVPKVISSPGSVGILLQVCLIYFAVSWRRRVSNEWFGPWATQSGNSSVDFSAVYIMLGSPFAARPLGQQLAGLGSTGGSASIDWVPIDIGVSICQWLAAAGIVTELVGPILLLMLPCSSRWRILPVILLVGLQAGINSVLYLTNFGLVASVTMFVFLPTPCIDWVAGMQDSDLQQAKSQEFVANKKDMPLPPLARSTMRIRSAAHHSSQSSRSKHGHSVDDTLDTVKKPLFQSLFVRLWVFLTWHEQEQTSPGSARRRHTEGKILRADGLCASKFLRLLALRLGLGTRRVLGFLATCYLLMLNSAEMGVPGVHKVDRGDIGEIFRLNRMILI